MDKPSKKNLVIIVAIVLAAGAIFFALNFKGETFTAISPDKDQDVIAQTGNNVLVVDGKQIVVMLSLIHISEPTRPY